MGNENSISINKYIADTGTCSRREADEMLRAGKVSLNGKKAKPGNRVEAGDVVKINGKEIGQIEVPAVYIALNKPVGVTCTGDDRVKNNVIELVNHEQRIFYIGRLDKDSEGLILLTNDGDIVNKILRATNEHEKEYIVHVNKRLTKKFLENMEKGVQILNTKTNPTDVEKIDENSFRIILKQGLNRQIRRMCTHLGYEVQNLQRVRIMNIQLGKLKVGTWRNLNQDELKVLLKALSGSKSAPASKLKTKENS